MDALAAAGRRDPFAAATKAFAAGTDTPRDYLERRLTLIGERDPGLGAFVCLNLPAARAAADRSTARWKAGRPLSPIDGMPVGIKDIIETSDMPTEMGSALFKGWRSGRDAASVAALREAGAIVVGKTVTTEFAAMDPRGTRNPHDPERTPGGSSSGSAAAVGAGFLPAALGTQGLGSIIRPASFCGCIGFKPTVGAINRGGSFDYLSQSCTGVLAASLADAWDVVYAASRAGGDPGRMAFSGPAQMPEARRPRSAAVLETSGWPAATAGAREAFQTLIAALTAKGVEIRHRRNDQRVEAVEAAIHGAMALTRDIHAWEFRWPIDVYRKRDPAGISRPMLAFLEHSDAMTADDYGRSLLERERVRKVYAALAGAVDVCLTLAAPGAAPKGLQSTGDATFAAPGSLLGVPALSLPVLAEEGLPLGLQLLGFESGGSDVFAIAAWITADRY